MPDRRPLSPEDLIAQRGVNDAQISPDGRAVAYLMDDPEPEEGKKRREAKDDPILFEARPRYARI
jgi:dipeptidyl aminopeptidase/acylaminoacyl peptidase